MLCVYPIAIYFVDTYLTPSQLMAGLLLLLAARVLTASWMKPVNRDRNIALIMLMLVAAVMVLLLMPGIDMGYLRLYPVLINLMAFAIFFGSLYSRMPLVERIARMVHSDLPPQGVIYTRYVTWVWCAVLLFSASVSLYTAIGTSLETWSLYNGLIVYFLFSSVFLCEYLVRIQLRRKWASA
jgi:uncharacterized membrane protein